ncbi:putative transcription factor interactor and regulator Znf-B family [Lupinus albus]|uniref:Putative transcription factor interactor and regulator Znf-B family n=1 Tax=Lupinus albus TaxID=3870 RepID=A0A6A4NJA7_LUPAL|nr:putative transcription factor interactor and regulator Znf-B family [Lupinus albus]
MFCHLDRALLCEDCDFSIHSVNDLTKKHHRFLINGTKISATAVPNPSSLTVNSTILDYLLKNIPGRQVEDFLDSPYVPFSFSKNGDDEIF